MKQDLERALKDYYNRGIGVAKRECLFNLPADLNAMITICAIDKEAIFKEAILQELKGDNMNYTTVLQELVDDIRFNYGISYERKQALLKLKEVHMWLKASANKGMEGELDLTFTPKKEDAPHV